MLRVVAGTLFGGIVGLVPVLLALRVFRSAEIAGPLTAVCVACFLSYLVVEEQLHRTGVRVPMASLICAGGLVGGFISLVAYWLRLDDVGWIWCSIPGSTAGATVVAGAMLSGSPGKSAPTRCPRCKEDLPPLALRCPACKRDLAA